MQFQQILHLLLFFIELSEPVIDFKFHDKILRFDAFLQRCTKNYYPIYNDKLEIRRVKNAYYYDWNIVVKENLNYKKGRLYVERCASREALDTCVTFADFKTKNLCQLMHNKGSAWRSGINDCMTREAECPMKIGNYGGVNCTLQMDAFNLFPFGKYYWRARFEFLDNKDKTIYCVSFEGCVVRK